MGLPIPNIRERLLRIAEELENPLLFPRTSADIAKELRRLSEATRRFAAVTQAPVVSRKMTVELAEEIIQCHLDNPELTQEQIAQRFGVAGGRVSEALNGKWRR